MDIRQVLWSIISWGNTKEWRKEGRRVSIVADLNNQPPNQGPVCVETPINFITEE